jgi:hypothetical protein
MKINTPKEIKPAQKNHKTYLTKHTGIYIKIN